MPVGIQSAVVVGGGLERLARPLMVTCIGCLLVVVVRSADLVRQSFSQSKWLCQIVWKPIGIVIVRGPGWDIEGACK